MEASRMVRRLWNCLSNLWLSLLLDRRQFFGFTVAAGLSVPVNLLSRIAFSTKVSFEAAVVLSHFCGMITAYVLTKLFVFERSGRPVRSEIFRFVLVNLASVTQTWIVAVGLLRFVFPALMIMFHPELIAHIIGLASSSFTSFFGHKYFSFASNGKSANAAAGGDGAGWNSP
jgi:putative flippase GtrA